MKILILSASHPFKYAGIIVKDINRELNKRGHDSILVVKDYDNYVEEDIINYHSRFGYLIYKYKRKILIKLKKFYKKSKVDKRYLVQTHNQSKSLLKVNKVLRKIPFVPDVIFVFFTQRYVTFKDMYNLSKITKAPILYSIPDMAAFTGLCHYSWSCQNYENSCGSCPAIYSNKRKDKSYFNLQAKIGYAKRMDIYGMGISKWIIEKAERSSVFRDRKIFKLPAITTREEFKPVSKELKNDLRVKNDIDIEAFVISFGAIDLCDERKGVKYIVEAINRISDEAIRDNIFVLYSGKGDLPINLTGVRSLSMGLLDFDSLLQLYQMSDVYISASTQDVGPGTIMEAITCGIPVVSFNVGVSSEWVVNNVTGYLAKSFISNEILKGILLIYEKVKDNPQYFYKNCTEFSRRKNNFPQYYNAIEDALFEISNVNT